MKKNIIFALIVSTSVSMFGMQNIPQEKMEIDDQEQIAINQQELSPLLNKPTEILFQIFFDYISTDKHGRKLEKGEIYRRLSTLCLLCKKTKNLLPEEKIKKLLITHSWNKTYSRYRDTAVHRKVFRRNLGNIKALVEHGAPYNEENKELLLPLDIAYQKLFFAKTKKARQTLKEIVMYLLSLEKTHLCTQIWLYNKYLKIERSSNLHGDTLLHIAAMTGSIDLIEHCLNNPPYININNENNYGKTALYYAAENGHRQVVEILLNRGANPVIRGGRFYELPGERAQAHGHTSISNRLLEEEKKWSVSSYKGKPFYTRIYRY